MNKLFILKIVGILCITQGLKDELAKNSCEVNISLLSILQGVILIIRHCSRGKEQKSAVFVWSENRKWVLQCVVCCFPYWRVFIVGTSGEHRYTKKWCFCPKKEIVVKGRKSFGGKINLKWDMFPSSAKFLKVFLRISTFS